MAWSGKGKVGRIEVTTDGGESWTPLRNGLPDRLTPSFQAVSIEDWGDSCAIYGATVQGAIWASEDGGESWAEIVSGLPPISKSTHYLLLG